MTDTPETEPDPNTEPDQETSLQPTEDQPVATPGDQGAVSVGDGINLSVNVTQAAAAPQVVVVAQSTAPSFLVRAIWFVFIGSVLSGNTFDDLLIFFGNTIPFGLVHKHLEHCGVKTSGWYGGEFNQFTQFEVFDAFVG